MRALALAGILVAGCTYSAAPPTPDELALRGSAAIRGSDLDRALFCGADPGRVISAAKTEPPPRMLPPTMTRDYRELLVSRERVTVNLRGSNADNPDCLALQSRPDLAGLWPP